MDENAHASDALVRAFLAAWERRDSEFILSCFSDDAVYHAVPLRPLAGKDTLTSWVEGFSEVPPGRLEVHHQVAAGDVVMNERADTITIRGVPVVLRICAVFELHGGSITAWREYFDLAAVTAAVASTG